MNAETTTPLPAAAAVEETVSTAQVSRWSIGRCLTRNLALAWKLTLGAIFCQTWITSVLVVGWTYRTMRRFAVDFWESQSPAASREPNQRRTKEHCVLFSDPPLPSWILQEPFSDSLKRAGMLKGLSRLRGWLGCGMHSLKQNAVAGIQGILNVWILTLPAGVLWLFAWYNGWNNSFFKGYEQASVGPLTGILGIALFIAAMLYLPLAQARQAVTGQWRSFYEFKLVRVLIRRRWAACAGIAFLYALFCAPVMILKTIPGFLPQINPALMDLNPAEQLQFLNRYFLACGFVVFPLYVILRLVAARVYASAVLDAFQRGAIAESDLSEFEWKAFHRLDLLKRAPQTPRPFLIRAAAWLGSRTGRWASLLAAILIWFGFAAQIYISEFLAYHPKVGWLNQTLVQLPYFQYAPKALKQSAKEHAVMKTPKPD